MRTLRQARQVGRRRHMLIGVCSAGGHCLTQALRLAIQVRETKNGSWGSKTCEYAMWVKNV